MSSNCIHVTSLGDYTKEDIIKKQQDCKCDTCSNSGPNLWICLHYDCLYVGCGEHGDDHSTQHFKSDPEHCLTLNLASLRLWCYLCECEVFLGNNSPPVSNVYRRIPAKNVSIASADPDTDEETFEEDHNLKPRGLTGLQNIGNSCYMNSAIQALSNCPPLTHFFLDCSSFVRSEKKPGLSKSYLKLMSEMWHKKRPSYLVPSSIAYGIKMVCPMFRGYTQQDSQEFLRCFMDQLHEELKEPCVDFPATSDSDATSPSMEIDVQIDPIESGEDSSQSEAEYETCDSGLSSEKSSCSEDLKESQDGINGAVPRRMMMSSGFSRGGGGVGGNRESFLLRRASSPPTPHENGYHSLPRGDCGGGNRQEPDSVAEYSDAMSDTLPLSQNHVRSSSPSAASLPERPTTFASEKQHQLRGMSTSVPQIKVQTLLPGLGFNNSSAVTNNFKTSGASKGSGRRKKQTKYHSIISDVFDGKILSSVQCLTCDRVSSTKETFQDLSLPIPSREYLSVLHASQCNTQKGALSTCTDVYSNQGWFSWMFSWMKSLFWGPTVSLQDCLAAFFSADELKGDNMYSCEKCKKLRNGIKYSKVLELPEILCVHLKRFRHEVMFSAKLSSYVSFPLEGLDMQPLLHKDCQASVTTYDLVAVICHHGTAGGGHYTAYALNCINDQWYEFDDQYVTEVDPQLVANSEAYVLFYRKTSEEMMKKRQRAVELMEMSKREPSLMQFYISKQWVNKFNTFAEPGPIDNTDFLCPHGGVHPNKFGFAEELCTILSQGVWEYLHHSFGGGPPCTHLYLCPTCQQEIDFLEGRRKLELDEFMRLHHECRGKESAINIYVISMAWFRIWEAFVKGKDDEPPGPIDNNAIAINKMGQLLLKPGSDYAQLSEDVWMFLHGIYGGGPILTIPPSGSGSDSGVPSTVGSNTSFVVATTPSSLRNGPTSPKAANPVEVCSEGEKAIMDCEEEEEEEREKLETVMQSDYKPMDVVNNDEDEGDDDDEKTRFIIPGSRTTTTMAANDEDLTHLPVVT